MKLFGFVVLCLVAATSVFAGDGGERTCDSCINIDATITPTPTYQTVAGSTIGQPNSEYTYSFCAVAGGAYRFSFCEGGGSATWDTALSIQGPDVCGAVLACNDDWCGLQSQLDFVAPSDGTYIIVVDGYSVAEGAYTLAYRGPTCPPNPVGVGTWGAIKAIYR